MRLLGMILQMMAGRRRRRRAAGHAADAMRAQRLRQAA